MKFISSQLALLSALFSLYGSGHAQTPSAAATSQNLPTSGHLLNVDFNAGNPWPGFSKSSSSSGVISRVAVENSGTIDSYRGSPSVALALTADFSKAKGKAAARLTSGALAIKNTESNLAKLTLGFDLWVGELRPVRVVVQSVNAAGQVTGSRFTTVIPPVQGAFYRFSLDLDKTKPLQGRFDPLAPKIQFHFELNDADQPVSRVRNQLFRVDNVSFSAPAFYVSVNGSDTANGRTEKTAFATIQKAIDSAGPGDVICLMAGNYTNDDPQQLVLYTKNGSPARWIVLRANPGARPELRPSSWNAIRINGAGSYFEIRGLTVRGHRRELKLEDALADGLLKTKDDVSYGGDPKFNGNGISIQSSSTSQTERPHHIRIIDNTVVDNAGGGISAIGCDYVTIENNRAIDNCHFMRYAGSGISVFRSWDFDKFKGHKMFVVGNTTHGNRCFVPWASIGKISDGNGIIVDDNINYQKGASQIPYEGRTLVQNNLSYGNGGSGIHAYASRFVDIVNNTAYYNVQSPELRWSQIFAGGRCEDIQIVNNILYAPKGRPLDLSVPKSSQNVNYAYNIVFGDGDNGGPVGGGLGVDAGNSGGTAKGGFNLAVNPQFVNATLDADKADFRVHASSPAVDSGEATATGVPIIDIYGTRRPQNKGVDRGAYELPATR